MTFVFKLLSFIAVFVSFSTTKQLTKGTTYSVRNERNNSVGGGGVLFNVVVVFSSPMG